MLAKLPPRVSPDQSSTDLTSTNAIISVNATVRQTRSSHSAIIGRETHMPLVWLQNCFEQSRHLDPIAWLESARKRGSEAAVVYDEQAVDAIPSIDGRTAEDPITMQDVSGGCGFFSTPASKEQAALVLCEMESFDWYRKHTSSSSKKTASKKDFFTHFENEVSYHLFLCRVSSNTLQPQPLIYCRPISAQPRVSTYNRISYDTTRLPISEVSLDS